MGLECVFPDLLLCVNIHRNCCFWCHSPSCWQLGGLLIWLFYTMRGTHWFELSCWHVHTLFQRRQWNTELLHPRVWAYFAAKIFCKMVPAIYQQQCVRVHDHTYVVGSGTGGNCYFVVLSCISPIANEVEHLFIGSLGIHVSFPGNCSFSFWFIVTSVKGSSFQISVHLF